jgi:hypothetical protein
MKKKLKGQNNTLREQNKHAKSNIDLLEVKYQRLLGQYQMDIKPKITYLK